MKKPDLKRMVNAVGADMREFALLWLVFANLDVFVEGHLTVPWIIENFIAMGALWFIGAYIEARGKAEER